MKLKHCGCQVKVRKYRLIGETRHGPVIYATYLDKGKAYFECRQANEGKMASHGWYANAFHIKIYEETPLYEFIA